MTITQTGTTEKESGFALSSPTTSANDANNSGYSREQIDNTPFHIIGSEDEGYFLLMGNHRMTEAMGSPDEVKGWLKVNMWTVVVTVACVVFANMNETMNKKQL